MASRRWPAREKPVKTWPLKIWSHIRNYGRYHPIWTERLVFGCTPIHTYVWMFFQILKDPQPSIRARPSEVGGSYRSYEDSWIGPAMERDSTCRIRYKMYLSTKDFHKQHLKTKNPQSIRIGHTIVSMFPNCFFLKSRFHKFTNANEYRPSAPSSDFHISFTMEGWPTQDVLFLFFLEIGATKKTQLPDAWICQVCFANSNFKFWPLVLIFHCNIKLKISLPHWLRRHRRCHLYRPYGTAAGVINYHETEHNHMHILNLKWINVLTKRKNVQNTAVSLSDPGQTAREKKIQCAWFSTHVVKHAQCDINKSHHSRYVSSSTIIFKGLQYLQLGIFI